MNVNVKKGDKVKFLTRGQTTTVGTVIRVRIMHRKGRVRELARAVTGDPGSLDREVAEIVPDSGTGIWTVGLSHIIEVIGRGDLESSIETAENVRGSRREQEAARRERNLNAAEESDLRRLKNGEEIEIQFRGGYWSRVIFRGFVPDSGNVRFEQFGRIRTTSPQFVRKIKNS